MRMSHNIVYIMYAISVILSFTAMILTTRIHFAQSVIINTRVALGILPAPLLFNLTSGLAANLQPRLAAFYAPFMQCNPPTHDMPQTCLQPSYLTGNTQQLHVFRTMAYNNIKTLKVPPAPQKTPYACIMFPCGVTARSSVCSVLFNTSYAMPFFLSNSPYIYFCSVDESYTRFFATPQTCALIPTTMRCTI
jgi:hypothetical protein